MVKERITYLVVMWSRHQDC